ncbi:uncharacterized protein PV06_10608 [Exophiala oligosperma]|uniref:Heterokaryon incompatibility domain-containing protein n=1 Tax=Exophiala oligosperma TaxID=215243 RepID=A0A0D2AA70_9EURO|nr:uncharacterized protein PV06_10608 [Exophiala oligosperma]KIW37266.1 hypothetical protein PV06_10608 [Exophiala oligosperma]
MVHVKQLSEPTKIKALDFGLRKMRQNQQDENTVLEKLNQLNPLVAKRFQSKSTAVSKFILRLADVTSVSWGMKKDQHNLLQTYDLPLAVLRDWSLARKLHSGPQDPDSTSFIAVSYCWRDGSWPPINSLTDTGSPLTLEMWRAISELRSSDDEGIWLDQLCVNQKDEREKQDAIIAMDILYQSARIVVIVLEDISLSIADVELCQKCASGFSLDKDKDNHSMTMADYYRLREIFQRIIKARLFSRAWCMQEYLKSDDAFLLVRVTESLRIVAIPGLLFLVALGKPMCHSTEHVGTGDSIDDSIQNTTTDAWPPASDIKAPSWPTLGTSYPLNYSYLLAYWLAMNASIEPDKVAIALNLSGLDLSLDTSGLSADACCYAYCLVALAAGDWSPLCNRGELLLTRFNLRSPFDSDTGSLQAGWLRRPNSASRLSLSEFSFPAVSDKHKIQVSFDKLELDMRMLAGQWTEQNPHQ